MRRKTIKRCKKHDWEFTGQVLGGPESKLYTTWRCRVCCKSKRMTDAQQHAAHAMREGAARKRLAIKNHIARQRRANEEGNNDGN